MRLFLTSFFLFSAMASVFAQTAKPLAERLAAQNALFDEYYETELRNHPESATAYGDYRYNQQLDDYSLAGIARHHEDDQAFLKRVEAITSEGFPEQDQLSHDLLIRVLQQRIADFDLKEL
jgi:uncharacterized protein (DUF885 family)